MSTQQYSSIGGYAAQHPSSLHENASTSAMSAAPNSAASALVANSMKYLRTTT